MSEAGTRPGGLTVLAVLSFIWGGLSVLSYAMISILLLAGKKADIQGPRGAVSASALWIVIIAMTVSGAILIFAGVGFLKQKRFLGRVMGSVYAIVTLLTLTVVQAIEPRLFDFSTVMGVVYALLILMLVNLTFRRDLVR